MCVACLQYLHVRDALLHNKTASEYESSERIVREYPNPRVTPPPFETFLRHSAKKGARMFADNFETRYFAGASTALKPEGQLTEVDLLRAMCNLGRFDVVLRVESDMYLLDRALGWMRQVRSGTRTDTQSQLSRLPPSTLKLLHEKTRLDERLYQFATQMVQAERLTGNRWPQQRVWRGSFQETACGLANGSATLER